MRAINDWTVFLIVILAGWKAAEIAWWIIKGASHL